MGRFKVKNIEIIAMSDKEYGKHLNDQSNKVKNRKAKSEELIILTFDGHANYMSLDDQ